MSFVDVQPSESMRLNDFSTADLKQSIANSGSTIASVITTESIVAKDGASIPAPFAIPAKETPFCSRKEIFGFESVVIIAVATSTSDDSLKDLVANSIPVSRLSIGNRTPIKPVEQTITSAAETPTVSATFSAVL